MRVKGLILVVLAVLALSACDDYTSSKATVNLPTGPTVPMTTTAIPAEVATAWLNANAAPFVKKHHGNVGIILAETINGPNGDLDMAVETAAGQEALVVTCGYGSGLSQIYQPGDLFTWHWNDECDDPQMGDLTLLEKAVVK